MICDLCDGEGWGRPPESAAEADLALSVGWCEVLGTCPACGGEGRVDRDRIGVGSILVRHGGHAMFDRSRYVVVIDPQQDPSRRLVRLLDWQGACTLVQAVLDDEEQWRVLRAVPPAPWV